MGFEKFCSMNWKELTVMSLIEDFFKANNKFLALLGGMGLIIGSLVGFGACSLIDRDDDTLNVEEVRREIDILQSQLDEKDSEIEALKDSIGDLQVERTCIISDVEWHLQEDYLIVYISNVSDYRTVLTSVGVRYEDPDAAWYFSESENPIWTISIPPGQNSSSYYWYEENSEAPVGFLAPNRYYKIAITYFGGYDEITTRSPGGSGDGGTGGQEQDPEETSIEPVG